MTSILAKLWRLLKLPKNIQLNIMRFTQDLFLVGTTGIVFNDKDEILLFKHTYRQNQWSLPGGYMKATEHPSEGLEREIEEESGFIVRIDKEIKIRADRETARLDIAYIGAHIGGKFKSGSEVSEARFFSFEDLPIVSKNQLLMIKEALEMKAKQHLSPKTNQI